MNPILASGLIGIGEKLVTNLVGSVISPAKSPEGGVPSFESLMKGNAVSGSGELGTFLSTQGVSSWEDLARVQEQLAAALQNQPGVAEKLAGLKPGTPLNLKITDGNLITIESPEGTVATLARDSEAGMLANRLHELKSMTSLHEQMPGSTLQQAMTHVQQQPILNASWVLRQGV